VSNKFLVSRRLFLKALGVTGLAINLYPFDVAEVAGWPDFNPNHQYGDDPIHLSDFVLGRFDAIIAQIIRVMDNGVKKTIPPKYRKRVEYHIVNPKPSASDPLGLRGACYWIYRPNGKGGVFVE